MILCYVHTFPGDLYRKIKKKTFPPLVKQMKDSVFIGLQNNPPNIQQQYFYFSHFGCFVRIKDLIYKWEIAIYIISTIQIENWQHLTFLINNSAAFHINSYGIDASQCAIISFQIEKRLQRQMRQICSCGYGFGLFFFKLFVMMVAQLCECTESH